MDGALRTSYGNAGVLAAGAILPVPVPGLAQKLPKMVFSRDEPLFLEWRYLPRLLPFLAKYLSFARADHVAHCARSLSYLLSDSHAQHQSLAEVTGAERFISDEDFCFGYATETSYSQMSQAVCCAGRMAMRLRSSMGRLMRSEIRFTAVNLPKLCVIRTVAVFQIRGPIWPRFWRIFKRKAARCSRPN